MKKVFLTFLLLTSSLIMAQSKFSIGMTSSTIMPRFETNRVGYGATLDLSYQVIPSLEIMLSTGYMAWGNNVKGEYSNKIQPEILGVRYSFLSGFNGLANFYVLGEVQKVFGKRNSDSYSFNEELDRNVYQEGYTEKFSEFTTALGLGTLLNVAGNFALDLNVNATATSQSQYLQNIRLNTGFRYRL